MGSRSPSNASELNIATPPNDIASNGLEEVAEVVAAVDLGSNSFHMLVAELRHGQLAVIDRIKETVRLAEGLTKKGDISPVARDRALQCLSRFGERLREVNAGNVRAAGTSTLRRAREDTGFAADAERALGHPIDIISGREEARLIYTGVTHSLPLHDGHRIVMDIGGGSTEVILGKGATSIALESLHLGCVSLTERYFANGELTREAFQAARVRARLELRPVKNRFRDIDDVQVIGTSGTINSAAAAAMNLGIAESPELTLPIIEALIDRVLEFDRIADIQLSGLSDSRAQVWPGGLSILAELFSQLRVEKLSVSDGALREGLLYDLLGRMRHEDARETTVRAMAARYQVDQNQAQRVVRTANNLFAQAATGWFDVPALSGALLEWAAQLHEIGLDISHDGYQRHGAYIAEHADMPGFPRAEQRLLAFLIGSQRHAIDKRGLSDLPRSWRQGAVRLAILLRLAVLMNRSRSKDEALPMTLAVGEQSLRLSFDADWLADNPLLLADLMRERKKLEKVDYSLRVS